MAKEQCPNCGKNYGVLNQKITFPDGSIKCGKCTTIKERMSSLEVTGANIKKAVSDLKKAMNISTDGKCPKCGGENIQVYSEHEKKGFSVAKGLCGGILVGPFGLLCGFCGNKDKSKAGRMCMTCGNKF
jgi:predicted Zn finger-like uncharacterized protein